ncbi:uncharacterized protein DDB_G0283697 [Aplysia californica]|uniref:Uncharacterized protein DDB_G0283697 n=1 Tax=Aplysia californica TaxID=6500 RepID=A0ABM0K4Z7_APLCA|nr:uncharacterized protein DDB_G0283697 [Aplysia californica]
MARRHHTYSFLSSPSTGSRPSSSSLSSSSYSSPSSSIKSALESTTPLLASGPFLSKYRGGRSSDALGKSTAYESSYGSSSSGRRHYNSSSSSSSFLSATASGKTDNSTAHASSPQSSPSSSSHRRRFHIPGLHHRRHDDEEKSAGKEDKEKEQPGRRRRDHRRINEESEKNDVTSSDSTEKRRVRPRSRVVDEDSSIGEADREKQKETLSVSEKDAGHSDSASVKSSSDVSNDSEIVDTVDDEVEKSRRERRQRRIEKSKEATKASSNTDLTELSAREDSGIVDCDVFVKDSDVTYEFRKPGVKQRRYGAGSEDGSTGEYSRNSKESLDTIREDRLYQHSGGVMKPAVQIKIDSCDVFEDQEDMVSLLHLF